MSTGPCIAIALTMNISTQNHPVPTFIVFPVRSGKVRCELYHANPPQALVLATMGSASFRQHPMTIQLAGRLAELGIITVLADLLTPEEFAEHRYRFDMEKISTRLRLLVKYLRSVASYRSLPFGVFGGGTGAEGTLIAAARMPEEIQALVCMDGLSGMERCPLDRILCPTLLISHNDDPQKPFIHEQTENRLKGWSRLEQVKSGCDGAAQREMESITEWFRQFLLSRSKRIIHSEPIAIHE